MASVLIVDDEPDMRNLLSFILKRAGFDVMAIGDGAEALARVAAAPAEFSAIVLDVMLPGMDGYSFALHVRFTEGAQAIPIVVVTAKPNMADVFCALPNVTALMEKPFGPQAVVEAVRKAVSGRG